MKNLSPTQIRVLMTLAQPGAVAYYMPYGVSLDTGWFRKTPYWFLPFDTTTDKTMQSLIRDGYVQYIPAKKMGKDATAVLTPAGRQALEELEGKS